MCWQVASCWKNWKPKPTTLYAHQNEDIVRLTAEQLKQRMADKEKAAQGA